jgi:RimJ/RimL family protein N-acetyltransferase
LHAYVAVQNIGSIRVLEKCGFRRVAARDLPPAATDEAGVERAVLVLGV